MACDDQTTAIQFWVDRLHSGDDSARAALLESAFERLTRLARKMLKSYPRVGRWEQTDDVLQNALIRLDRALRDAAPGTARDFFRLAAVQVRRELIDLARHYQGPEGMDAHHWTWEESADGSSGAPDVGEMTFDPVRLAAWTEFHGRIESLNVEDRELFDLLWYQGLTQAEAAALLELSERQVNRRWIAARLKLGAALDGHIPV
jgi:RNA polymerase sigma-70 factor (ECF subfamily)